MKVFLKTKRQLKLSLALIILFAGLSTGMFNSLHAQSENRKVKNRDKSVTILDSVSLSKTPVTENKKIKVSLNPFLNRSVLESKLLYWNYYNYSEPLESQLFFPDENHNDYRLSLYSLPDYLKSKNEFNKSLKQMLSFQTDTDLGVVGKILGYTGFAATIGLAIIHINKFKDIDKKKDEEKKK